MSEQNIVRQYRAYLTLSAPKPIVAEFVSDDLDVLKDKIRSVITGSSAPVPANSPRFQSAESTSNPGMVLIFHHQFNRGQTALGWISPEDVPEHMAVQGALDRLREAAA